MRTCTAIAGVLALVISSGSSAASYQINSDDSQILFTGEVSEERFDGRFHAFEGRIEFDPNALSDVRFDIRIKMGSVDTQSEERDEALTTNEWFDPEIYPYAHFQATGAKPDDNGYVSAAKLKIRNMEKPVSFSFHLDPDMKTLSGSALLNRTDWDLGGEDWSDEDLVSHSVLVEVEVTLHEQSSTASLQPSAP